MLALLIRRTAQIVFVGVTIALGATLLFGQSPRERMPILSDHDQITVNTTKLAVLEATVAEVKSEHGRITILLFVNLAAVITHMATRVKDYRRRNGVPAGG